MKIGICCIDMQLHGLSTSAKRWHDAFIQQGIDCTIYAFTPSGQPSNRMRTDFGYEVVPYGPKGYPAGLEMLKTNDLLWILGVPYAERSIGILEVIENSRVPCLTYTPQIIIMQYGLYPAVVNMENVIGHTFLRHKIYDAFQHSSLPDRVRKKPCIIVKHPALPRLPIEAYERFKKKTSFIMTTRLCKNKGTLTVVNVWRQHGESLEEQDVSLSIYGYQHGTINGRKLGLALEQNYGDMWKKIYKGRFDTKDWAKIYGPATFMIDLTNFPGDAGIQNTGIEALEHGVIPIVSKPWAVGNCMIPVDFPKGTKSVLSTIQDAVAMPLDERLDYVRRGQDYLCRAHDPATNVEKLLEFIEYARKCK